MRDCSYFIKSSINLYYCFWWRCFYIRKNIFVSRKILLAFGSFSRCLCGVKSCFHFIGSVMFYFYLTFDFLLGFIASLSYCQSFNWKFVNGQSFNWNFVKAAVLNVIFYDLHSFLFFRKMLSFHEWMCSVTLMI